jgi:cullin 1
MAEILKQHIAMLGGDTIENRMARMEGSSGDKEGEGKVKEKETADDPQFVRDLLNLHDKFIKVVNSEFCGNALFQKALKDAFVEVVNRDTGKFKSADLLSSFCDTVLKTGSSEKLSDTEMEEQLEKTVQMFSYLTDKDFFAEIYRYIYKYMHVLVFMSDSS